MANYSSLISAINAAIKQNGNQEITGPVLNSVLNAMVSSLGNGWQFGGVVTPASNPGSPDAKLFYLAWTPGTYTGFGNKVLEENKLGIFTKTGSTVTLDTVNLGGGPGTYVVTDLELLEPTSAASEQIDEAIGGFDNLVAAIQSGAVVLSADTTDYQHSYKVAVAELGDIGEGLASINILNPFKQELNRYSIQKASSGNLSMRLNTTSLKPIDNVYTVRMKGLKNASNSNEIISAIGSWPQLFAALSSNRVIMEVPTESEPYGSLYVCHIVAGSLTSGTIQLTTLDSSTGTIALKTYTISATSAVRLSVTIESISYVTSTDAEATYQKITDDTLATAAKTIVGAINEVNESVSKTPYNVGLFTVISKHNPTSEEIDAAIGGWDNLVYAIQHNRLIVDSITAEGTVQTLSYITVMSADNPNLIVLQVCINSVIVLINIINTDGILTLKQRETHILLKESDYDSLQTTDKTIIGSINEVDSNLESAVKPYVVDLTDLLAAQDSESISTAIGGIDNLNGTVQKNQVIFGTLANGTVAVGIRVLGNKTTLTYFVDSVVGLTVNEIIITNTSGTLTKTAYTHAVLTENMVINNLESDETTLPLSAAQGKALKEEADTNTGNVTRIDRAVGNPTINEYSFTVAESGKFWGTNGQKIPSASFNISNIISLKKGDLLSVSLSDFSVNVSLITKVSADGDFVKSVVPAVGLGGIKTWFYLADNDCYVQLSASTGSSDKYTIIKSPFNTAISDNSYMQYLHKVYEEYGAVYNAETGYWELNGLTDLTEENMWDIYLWCIGLQNMPDLNMHFVNSPIRTTLKFDFSVNYLQSTGTSLNQMCLKAKELEVFNISKDEKWIALSNSSSAVHNGFASCIKLRRVENVLLVGNNTSTIFSNTFSMCAELSYIKIRGLKQVVSFQDSPLLSYESIKYLVDNAANTAAITVTVHPTTYSYLTGTAQPATEVGGTTEEWQALVTTAQGKQISFAVPEETQSEVTE